MSKAIDKIRNAYQSKRRKLVVPEWDNLEMHFGPLTVDDMESVKARVRDPDSDYEQNVLLLIHKARDKEGAPLFGFGDKKPLMAEADVVVLQRAINFMWEGAASIESAEEEVRGNPTSGSA